MRIEEFMVKGNIEDLINVLQKVKNEYGNLEINTLRENKHEFYSEKDVSFDINKNQYSNRMYIDFY